jgi:hypothetical protein
MHLKAIASIIASCAPAPPTSAGQPRPGRTTTSWRFEAHLSAGDLTPSSNGLGASEPRSAKAGHMVARERSQPPMTLANMSKNGVRAVIATSLACGHKADVNVDALAETIVVPKAGYRLRCSQCGRNWVDTRPAWHTM